MSNMSHYNPPDATGFTSYLKYISLSSTDSFGNTILGKNKIRSLRLEGKYQHFSLLLFEFPALIPSCIKYLVALFRYLVTRTQLNTTSENW